MLKDRYTDSCLVYAASKKSGNATPAHVTEKLDELTHAIKTAESQVFSNINQDKRHYNQISQFTALCFKQFQADFTAISLQLVGSISLEKNLREVLSQLDFSDLKPFFTALELTFPYMPTSFAQADGERLFWVEILVRELKAKEGPSNSGDSLALFPTEEDLW
jgi:hypothetical protein